MGLFVFGKYGVHTNTRLALAQSNANTFATDKCDFSVTFPGPFETRKVTAQIGGLKQEVMQAELPAKDGTLLAKCLPFRTSIVDNVEAFKAEAVRYILDKSRIAEISPNVVEHRAYADFSGVQATSVDYAYVGKRSTLLITVVARSSVYPTSDMKKFLNSVKAKSSN